MTTFAVLPSTPRAARGCQEVVLIDAIGLFKPVSSGCTPLTPHHQPRPIPAANSHFHFPDPTTSPAPPVQKSRFEALRALRVCTGLGRANVGPCSTHPRASASSVAGGGGKQEAACGGGQIADFAILRKNCDLRSSVLIRVGRVGRSRCRAAPCAPQSEHQQHGGRRWAGGDCLR